MNTNWRVELTVVDEFGRVVGREAMAVDPFIARDYGLGIDLECPMPEITPGYMVIDTMKRREKRKGWLHDICMILGKKMAETMEDLEGWHGSHRRELTELHRGDDFQRARYR